MKKALSMLVSMSAVASFCAEKPNLLVIMTDDQGYNDVGFNRTSYDKTHDTLTPHIDTIAANGVKFTDGYVAYAVCGPSRAGFITGRYPQRFGFERNGEYDTNDVMAGVPTSELTIGESLQGVGYHTGIIGKWHLGAHSSLHPNRAGFDEFFGHRGGGHQYFPGELTIRNSEDAHSESDSYRTWIEHNDTPVKTDEYLTDEFSNYAVDFIENNKDEPFFLYLAYNAPHGPLQATQEYLDRFPDITDTKRKTYAAMVSAVDDGVGRVLAKLREHNLEEDTIIVFLSDNGGPEASNSSDNGVLRGGKSDPWDGGIRVPFAMQWKGRIDAGTTYTKPISSLDIFATISALSESYTNPAKPLDGTNLIPFLDGTDTGNPHEAIYLRKYDQDVFAVRSGSGPYKMVIPKDITTPRLFNLEDNISEDVNIADSNPAELERLVGLKDSWNSELIEPVFKGITATSVAVNMPRSISASVTSIEAEDGVFIGTPIVEAQSYPSGGEYLKMKSAGDGVTITANVSEAGIYSMTVHYYNKPNTETLNMTVNGGTVQSLSFPAGSKWAYEGAAATATFDVSLQSGDNTLSFVTTNIHKPHLDKFDFSKPLSGPVVWSSEAEAGVKGTNVSEVAADTATLEKLYVSDHKYVKFADATTNNTLTFSNVTIPADSTYRLKFAYWCTKGFDVAVNISVDGGAPTQFTAHKTVNAKQQRGEHLVVDLPLTAGTHTLEFSAENAVMVDYLVIAKKEATNYYVSDSTGDDNNNGLTPDTAFKSLAKMSEVSLFEGDRVLFKSGDTFVGQLHLNGSGTASNPIQITRYKAGNQPILTGSGGEGGDYECAIYLNNVEGVEITDIEIRNDRKVAREFCADEEGYGIFVHNNGFKDREYFRLYGLTMRNIYALDPGEAGHDQLKSGAAYFRCERNTVVGYSKKFKDIMMDSCYVEYIGKFGYWSWHGGADAAVTEDIDNSGGDSRKAASNEDVVVRGNHFYRTGGSGAQPGRSWNCIVEHNIFEFSGDDSDPRMAKRGSGAWFWACTNVIAQYNKSYSVRGSGDSYGMHIDYNNRDVILQHNYSEDSEGGFAEILGDNNNCVYRFNVSVNDGFRDHHGNTMWVSDYSTHSVANPPRPDQAHSNNNYFVNNTIYMDKERTPDITIDSKDTYIYNNIFYCAGKGIIGEVVDVQIYEPATYSLNVSNNLFYGNIGGNLTALDSNAVYGNPMFARPGDGDADAYKLLSGSPAIGAAKNFSIPAFPMAGQGIFANITGLPTEDKFGNDVDLATGTVSIGAYNGAALPVNISEPTTSVVSNTLTVEWQQPVEQSNFTSYTIELLDAEPKAIETKTITSIATTSTTFDVSAYDYYTIKLTVNYSDEKRAVAVSPFNLKSDGTITFEESNTSSARVDIGTTDSFVSDDIIVKALKADTLSVIDADNLTQRYYTAGHNNLKTLDSVFANNVLQIKVTGGQYPNSVAGAIPAGILDDDGVVFSFGDNADRTVKGFSFDYQKLVSKYFQMATLYSDDNGSTWKTLEIADSVSVTNDKSPAIQKQSYSWTGNIYGVDQMRVVIWGVNHADLDLAYAVDNIEIENYSASEFPEPLALVTGDIIAVDIGSTAGSADKFNVIDTSGGSIAANSVMKYEDGTTPAKGVSLALSAGSFNTDAKGNWLGTDAFYSTEAKDQIYNNGTITLTFSGLDDSLAYNARVYALINDGATDTISVTDGTETQSSTMVRSARFAASSLEDAGLSFNSLETDGAGNITVTVTSANGWEILNAVVLEVTTLTPAIGLELTQTDNLLEWTVEEEVNVKEYLVIDADGNVVAVIPADNSDKYSVVLDSDEPVSLVVVDNSGHKQTFKPEDGNEQITAYDLKEGWNLIAITSENANLQSLKDATAGVIWGWNGSAYELIDSAEPTNAIWVYCSVAKQIDVIGRKSDAKINLNSGWNMVGPVENDYIPENAISVFSWNDAYNTIAGEDKVLIEGVGYWIFAL